MCLWAPCRLADGEHLAEGAVKAGHPPAVPDLPEPGHRLGRARAALHRQ